MDMMNGEQEQSKGSKMATKQSPRLGTINGYASSVFKMGNRKLVFDGTTKGLVKVALANGAKVGTKLRCNYGGTSYDLCDTVMIIEPDASNRVWATRQWKKETPSKKTHKSSPGQRSKAAIVDEWQAFVIAISKKQYALAKRLSKAMKSASNKESAAIYLTQILGA